MYTYSSLYIKTYCCLHVSEIIANIILMKKNSFCSDIKSILILLNGMYFNGWLYYSGLRTTCSALSSVNCSELLYETMRANAILSSYLMSIYNAVTWGYLQKLTFYYLNENQRSIMLFTIIGTRRKKEFSQLMKIFH